MVLLCLRQALILAQAALDFTIEPQAGHKLMVSLLSQPPKCCHGTMVPPLRDTGNGAQVLVHAS